jgi:hypothetical protein
MTAGDEFSSPELSRRRLLAAAGIGSGLVMASSFDATRLAEATSAPGPTPLCQ